MNEIDYESVLKKYQTLISVIDDLQSKIDKLIIFYNQVKEKYDLYDHEVDKALKDIYLVKSQAIKEIDTKTKDAENKLAQATLQTNKMLWDRSNSSQHVTDVSNTLSNYANELKQLQGNVKNNMDNIVLIDRRLSGATIWKKYNQIKKSILIKRIGSSWTSDFYVEIIDFNEESGEIICQPYRSGRPIGNTKKFSDSIFFNVYKRQ